MLRIIIGIVVGFYRLVNSLDGQRLGFNDDFFGLVRKTSSGVWSGGNEQSAVCRGFDGFDNRFDTKRDFLVDLRFYRHVNRP